MTTLLFDLDGTLIDSTAPIRRSLDQALATFGLDPVGDDELQATIGPPLLISLTSLLAGRGADTGLAAELLAAYRSTYVVDSIELALAYPGIEEMLEMVGGLRRLGVVTSKPKIFAVPILETLGLARHFEVIEGPEIGESEEKPVTLARALDLLGIPAAETTLIGDRHFDIRAGKQLGTGTVGVTWGFGSRHELETAGADRIVESPSQIIHLANDRP